MFVLIDLCHSTALKYLWKILKLEVKDLIAESAIKTLWILVLASVILHVQSTPKDAAACWVLLGEL